MDSTLERATVVDNLDPTGRRRVRLSIPRIYGDSSTDWVEPLFHGSLPRTGSSIWVTFNGGDHRRPVYVPDGQDPASTSNYVHNQTTPSASWTVVHNLNRYPSVEVVVNNEVVLADVSHIDLNNLSIVFANATTGFAILG